jgi:hypothetical protein
MLEHCAANRKRPLSALPNVGPYIFTTLKFLALKGAPHIYDISRPRVKIIPLQSTRKENNWETEETLAGAATTVETERAK